MLSRIFHRINGEKASTQSFKQKLSQVSYAQSGEDLIIDFLLKQLNISLPNYLDIGAHHPYKYNNTAVFYDRGARGVNAEPLESMFGLLQKLRPEDINIQAGVGASAGEMTYFEMQYDTLNTFSETEAKRLESEEGVSIQHRKSIKVLGINDLMQQYFNSKNCDLLCIDTEGFETEILSALNFKKFSPSVICAETISYSSKGKGIKNKSLIQLLESKGYFVYADTFINTIFVNGQRWQQQ